MVNRDSFYQRIVERLNEVSDDSLFEHCATDLLRSEWPNLVPVPGGDDAGLDGAWADEQGPGLLVVTTSPRVIENVTKNLRRHLQKGGTRRRVLVATTQHLSAPRCRNIENRVRELKFKLAHYPYTQQAIADRLYHNSRWCHDLLGIAGQPPALSRIPMGLRPLRDLPLLHRDDDYDWVKTTSGDRVLAGHSGVGKTYLLQQYVNSGNALFVTDYDLNRITNAIRDQQPTALIVEDAHLHIGFLNELRRYRIESGLTFDIVADCWPAASQQVCQAMDVGTNRCRTIEPLTGKKIADVINAAGIVGPNFLMAELIRQSGGYPGRAAMLAHLCLTNNIEDVLSGIALSAWVRSRVGALPSDGAVQVLAAFALGGKDGMQIADVVRNLGYATGKVCEWMAELPVGGIVQEGPKGSIRVLPGPLRCALVKEYFFDRVPSLSLDVFLDSVNSLNSALSTLLGARSRGARVSTCMLVELLQRSPSSGLWEEFVSTDAECANLVLDRFSERIPDLGRPLLYQVPERTIPHLLGNAIGDHRALHSSTDHPLRLIHDWVESASQGTGESLVRRRTLWAAVRDWLKADMDWLVGGGALASVLSPHFNDGELMAADRMMFSIIRGSVRPTELQEIANLWPDIYDTLKALNPTDWTPIFSAIDQWIYWQHPSISISDDIRNVRDCTARKMLVDLRQLSVNRPGVQKQLRRRGNNIGLELEITIQREFSVLFPEEDFELEWKDRKERESKEVRKLAAVWALGEPNTIAADLVRCINEAKTSGREYPDYTPYICSLIAAEASDVVTWLDALMHAGAEGKHILPFLERAADERPDGWSTRVSTCLESDKWRCAAVIPILRSENVDASLLERVFEASSKCSGDIHQMCVAGQIADERVIRLLEMNDANLSESIATGLWHQESPPVVPEQIGSQWRRAVIAHVGNEYDLCEMMRADKRLAFDWLMDRAVNDRDSYYREKKAYAVAAEGLTDEERRTVIDNLNPENYCAVSVVAALVGMAQEMYKYVLSKEELKRQHLSPLRRKPTAEWCDLACLALNAGCTPSEIASVAFQGGSSFGWGSISSRQESRMQVWAELGSHRDFRIRDVARMGEESARHECEFWQRMEKSDEFNEYFG